MTVRSPTGAGEELGQRSGHRRSAQREATRARLFEETVSEFSRRGVADTEIAVIAERVGLSRSAFYVHFNDKDEVLTFHNTAVGGACDTATQSMVVELFGDDCEILGTCTEYWIGICTWFQRACQANYVSADPASRAAISTMNNARPNDSSTCQGRVKTLQQSASIGQAIWFACWTAEIWSFSDESTSRSRFADSAWNRRKSRRLYPACPQ